MRICLAFLLLLITAVSLSACLSGNSILPGSKPIDVTSDSDPVAGIVFVTTRHVDQQTGSLGQNWELYLVQPDGTGLTRLTDNDVVDTSPSWSPDGRQIAYRSRVPDASSDIFIMNADGSNPRNLINDSVHDQALDEFFPEWSPSGDKIALYTDRHTNSRTSLNGCALHRAGVMEIDGGKDNIRALDAWLGNQESMGWHPDGVHLAVSTRCHEGSQSDLILWNVETDEVSLLTNDVYADTTPAFSPDGRFLAYLSFRNGQADIYMMDMSSGEVINLTNAPSRDTHPTWSPDGTQIAFVSNRDGNEEIYVMNSDGTDLRNITNHPAKDFEPDWSPVAPP
jgi:Tol biopolymer transport system component